MRSAGPPARRNEHDGDNRQYSGSARRVVSFFSRPRHAADARRLYAHAGRYQGRHARQHVDPCRACLLSPGLDPETRNPHLLRADDQSGVFACAGACRPPDPDPNGARDDRRRTARCPKASARRRMIRRISIIVAVTLFGLVFASLAANHVGHQSLPPLAKRYVELVPQHLGAPNVVTGILLTYRAFDTLGEVAVLFMVAAGVGLILRTRA